MVGCGSSSLINNRNSKKRGRGLLNKIIDKLPVELHFLGYNYYGPCTKLARRLQRGDRGINPLDEACKEHDISYSKFQDVVKRNQADKELAETACKRVTVSDSNFAEKLAALGVGGLIIIKNKFGMDLSVEKNRASKKKDGQINLKVAVIRKLSSKERKQREEF
ncbi:hypothetical protein NQ314_012768 [Rhamnusium bicolor]|uniref:Phospholipase A2-like domain-containing protein n=1 Tax=Rhamnusium bicolor TaxID=1586634 RepID=A0AAV8XAI6_9CUCU|nr:hypothetical protein NQ314_012768 [Rhamnusium bicolor]